MAGPRRHRHDLRPSVNLIAGAIQCSREPALIGTILGSCVAVCLWDRRLRVAGMNHFILATCPDGAEPSARYGDIAIPRLVQALQELGSNVSDLEAKLFGGANVLPTDLGDLSVGARNIEIAISLLQRYRIPVVAKRLSGASGVFLIQCTDCGDVWLRTIVDPLTTDRGGAVVAAPVATADPGAARFQAEACTTCGVSSPTVLGSPSASGLEAMLR